MRFIKKIRSTMESIFYECQFGFVKGHTYLSKNDLKEVKLVLNSANQDQNEKILSNYEKEFAKVVGPGWATSFASGRMAFYVLMDALGIGEGDEVILTAFTCSVMANAIIKKGAIPIYSDLDRQTFGTSADSVNKSITSKTRLIVAQHSFGIPCDIDSIISIARKKNIFVIEDCAIAFDSTLNGVKVGNWADAAIFSTDHTKPINTIIGGIAYTNNPALHEKILSRANSLPSLSQRHQKSLYGQIKFERIWYTPYKFPRSKVYRAIRAIISLKFFSKKNVFLDRDYGHPSIDSNLDSSRGYPYPARLPPFLAVIGLHELRRWSLERCYRKKILLNLIELCRNSKYSDCLPGIYANPNRQIIPLRFIFCTPEVDNLLTKLKKFIDINSIWFRYPISSLEGISQSLNYKSGSCKISEEICKTIVNIPCNINAKQEQLFLKKVKNTFVDLS